MTNTEFKACLGNYRKALLGIIPAYYSRPSFNLVKAEPPEDLEDVMVHLTLDSTIDRNEFLDSNKKSSCEYADFTKKMKKVLQYIDSIAQENDIPLFRFRFFEKKTDEYREANLISGSVERDAKSINSSLWAYLRYLKESKRYNEYKASELIKEKMHSYEKKYLQEYGDIIEKFLGSKPKRKRKPTISDSKLKQLCKDLERDGYTREDLGEKKYFKKFSEMSKSTKYDKSGKGYTTWMSAKKRYYNVFPSKKENH